MENIKANSLPQQLYFDIKQAAGDYEIAKLERSIDQIAQQDPNNKALSTHLGYYLCRYDMEGLLTELDKVQQSH